MTPVVILEKFRRRALMTQIPFLVIVTVRRDRVKAVRRLMPSFTRLSWLRRLSHTKLISGCLISFSWWI